MAGHTHLSIGEVLSLLQEEFPDVTISKIRFLESQGLVDPERTPSGYRKFYDADIERLRWVLRQQRDAFLPLKVIKGRLAEQEALPFDDGLDGGPEQAGVPVAGASDVTVIAVPPALVAGQARATPRGAGGSNSTAGGREPWGGAVPERLWSPASAYGAYAAPTEGQEQTLSTAGLSIAAGVPASTIGQHNDDGRAGAGGNSSANRRGDTGADRGLGREAGVGAESVRGRGRGPVERVVPRDRPAGEMSGQGERVARPAQAVRSPGGGEGGSGARQHRGVTDREGPVTERAERVAGPAATGPAPPAPSGSVRLPDEEELTLDELLHAAGVDVETVRDLEHYGLISTRLVAGTACYGRDAVVIARLASAFARHGVEARHLRAYKGAVDREAGMVQQVIMPLIRQRNPDARLAASRAAEELSELGGALRAALLRSALDSLR
ncbi:MAG TPA: MerR family transcriptional regulator [Acidimicrobiales bacterium]|nr:MerR family transcriptional regulator [Acidimicrobiales bacterium]